MLFDWAAVESWTPLVASMPTRRRSDLAIRDLLREHYCGIKVYHAARPVDPSSYYKLGLLLADYGALRSYAERLFCNDKFPHATSARLAQIADDIGSFDDRRAFVSVDARGYADGAGQYLIYGSEYLCALAAALGPDCERELRSHGMPTIFTLQLDFSAIEPTTLRELASSIGSSIARVRRGRQPGQIDFTITLRDPVPAGAILSHHHPEAVADPLHGGVLRRFARHSST